MSQQVMKSYVHHDDKVFFVSTINRESSSMFGGMYAETMVWEWDPETRERGVFVGQGEGPMGSIYNHQSICQQLFNHGSIDQ